jgi:hypothetical protein
MFCYVGGAAGITKSRRLQKYIRHQNGNYEQCDTKFACHISGFAVVHRKQIKEPG